MITTYRLRVVNGVKRADVVFWDELLAGLALWVRYVRVNRSLF